MRRKRFGKQVNPETDIVEEDLVLIKALELEGSNVKDKGHQTGFSLMVSRVGDEDIKKKLLGGKVGDTFDFDIYTIEKDVEEKYVKKYLLNLDDEEEKEIGKNFRGEIEKITRVELADLDQDFFDQAFGEGKIKSETEAKTSIKDELSAFYEKIEVSPEELRESVKKKIMSYMAQYQQSDFDVEPMINNYLGNREQVEKEYEEAMAEKLFGEIYDKVTLKPEKISIEDFREKIQEMNKAINQ